MNDRWLGLARWRAHTFYSKRGGACGLSVLVLGLAAVGAGVLGEDVEQHQRVLLIVMEKLARVAGGQSLCVLAPGHPRLRDAAHVHREAHGATRRRHFGLHVTDDLRRFWY